MTEFLREIKEAEVVEFGPMVGILVGQYQRASTIHPINSPYGHNLSTHPIDTLSTHLVKFQPNPNMTLTSPTPNFT